MVSVAGPTLADMTPDDLTQVLGLERDLRALAHQLTAPRSGECLLCYVNRMLDLTPCTGLRWAVRYRDLVAPRATGLERRLGRAGAYCDCEVFLNGWGLRQSFPEGPVGAEGPQWPDPFPRCRLVAARSTQACRLWGRLRG